MVWMTTLSVASSVLLLRSCGLLQSLEWAALDQSFRLRPLEPTDERVVVVAIEEKDLQKFKWPISDATITQLLKKLQASKPRAIGLDIYRDLTVEPGHGELVKAFESMPNLIGIEQLPAQDRQVPGSKQQERRGDTRNTLQDSCTSASVNVLKCLSFKSDGVLPAQVLSQRNQVGFNNVVLDADGKMRRRFLYAIKNGKVEQSFALKLALIYLKAEGINPRPAESNSQYLQLNHAVFRRFQPDDGAYVGADDGGYQVLANFRHPGSKFRTVSMADVLSDRLPASLVRDRIVVIGSTAPSLNDFFYTSYSGSLIRRKTAQPTAGVELHANFVSQILSAATSGRPLIQTWSHLTEDLWIFAWAWVGAILSWRLQRPNRSALSILLAASSLIGSSYLALIISGWWLPLVPSLLTLCGSGAVVTTYLAHLQQELKRSKEFLHRIINTIPDPVFVKNEEHKWVVLNEAYCQFIGYPVGKLIEKLDYDFLPKHEVDIFRQQDEFVFHYGTAIENEEEFTDAKGTTHLIATKRSLHKDAAGNAFLVGVIRDVTERKRLEAELRRNAAELLRSNTELRLSEDRLRHLAHHDSLTGLPNRQLFYQHLSHSLERARSNNALVALLFIDLDGFKQVNDTLGHDNGDRLLQAVAQRLNGCLRGGDIVSRLGGDEFTIILTSVPKVQVAATVAEKILATITEVFILEERPASVTASIGISVYPIHSDSPDVLIKQADTAMFRAKELGKNRYEFA